MKWDETTTGIYQIKNKVNGKLYIGKATNLYRRKYQHFTELKKNKHQNKHLQFAFNKYGFDNFVFEIIEECKLEVIGEREYYWINHYNTWNRDKGYNIELLNENGVSIKSYESIKQLRLTLKNNKGKYVKPKGKDNPTSKEVYQYGFNGEFIKSYESCHIAAETLGNRLNFTSIARCARNYKQQTACGFQWRYFYCEQIPAFNPKEENIKILKKNNELLARPIIATHLTNMKTTEFNSLLEASNKLKLAISCIARIAKGERKHSRKLNMTFKFKTV